MFCFKCGEAIPDGSSFCPHCGANLVEEEKEQEQEQSVVYASQKEPETVNEQPKTHKKVPKGVLAGIIVIVCVAAIGFIVNGINQANLKKKLVKEWYALDGSIIKVLDIDDDEMEYRLETGYQWMNTSLGTYDWKPVSGNKIKIKQFGDKYKTYTIELNEDKDMLKISPAITSTDSSETWYHVD
jgi:uncharacterized Zn finger protein (UPF0148 family)